MTAWSWRIGINLGGAGANKLTFVQDTNALWTYHDASNTCARVIEDSSIDYRMTAEIDLKRRMLIFFGGGQVRAVALDKEPYQMKTWDSEVTGCNALRDAENPERDLKRLYGAHSVCSTQPS